MQYINSESDDSEAIVLIFGFVELVSGLYCISLKKSIVSWASVNMDLILKILIGGLVFYA